MEMAGPLGDAVLFSANLKPVPVWLCLTNVISNVMLNALNWHWFLKMITAVRKRFDSPPPSPSRADEEKSGGQDDKSNGTSTGRDRPNVGDLPRRRYSIEQVVQEMQPDSNELREGTIQ